MSADVNTEITELERINHLMQSEDPAVIAARIDSPVKAVEGALSQFVKDAFDVTRSDFEFGKVIQDKLMQDIQNGSLNPNQLIALYSSFAVNSNDKISKLLSPIMQLMTARQQAELAAAASVANAHVNAEKANEITKTAPKDVLQGMKQLQDFLEVFQSIKQQST